MGCIGGQPCLGGQDAPARDPAGRENKGARYMLRLVNTLVFTQQGREPYNSTAAIQTDEIVSVEPAGWEVTRWRNGAFIAEILFRNGKVLYVQGRPEDFVEGSCDA